MCAGVESIKPLVARLDAAGIKYTMSKSGRPAVFFRDPGGFTMGGWVHQVSKYRML